MQHTLVEHQVAAALASAASCPDCGIPHRHKDNRPIVIRTLFGTVVEVVGVFQPLATNCMQGTPFEVTRINPV